MKRAIAPTLLLLGLVATTAVAGAAGSDDGSLITAAPAMDGHPDHDDDEGDDGYDEESMSPMTATPIDGDG